MNFICTRLVFDNVLPEHDSVLILLYFLFPPPHFIFVIICPCKEDSLTVLLCFPEHLRFALDFSKVPCGDCLEILSFPSTPVFLQTECSPIGASEQGCSS